MSSVEYLTDGVHLICVPYTRPQLHAMAIALGIKRCWFHPGKRAHYDIPPKMRADLVKDRRVTVVSSKQIVKAIKASSP